VPSAEDTRRVTLPVRLPDRRVVAFDVGADGRPADTGRCGATLRRASPKTLAVRLR